MDFLMDKIRVCCEKLREWKAKELFDIKDIMYTESGYKSANTPGDNVMWNVFNTETLLKNEDSHYWFKFRVKTPAENTDHVLRMRISEFYGGSNPQGIVYFNGKMVQGTDRNHEDVPLEYDTDYEVLVYYYTNPEGGGYSKFVPKVFEIDTRIEKLYYDMFVPYEAAKCLSRDDDNCITIVKYLNNAEKMLDMRVPFCSDFYDSIQDAEDYLEREFYNGVCGNTEISVKCIGHTHIDVAWLWRLRQTREKVQRSFSTVLELMDEYPEYKFMSSQPQLYMFLKEEAPEVYDRVKEKIKEGRWEAEGAMWLEADCNLTSGESLVRQILFGKRFMKKEFGVESHVLWLPDVFGYSAALPQILKKSGVDKFVTSKISWNETNKLPYDTFMWEGIDGSEIFTYFMTARDYNPKIDNDCATSYSGFINSQYVLGTWKRYQQKEYNKEVMISFGFGDGGGGPTRDMLEQQRRFVYGIPGYAKTEMEFAGSFLDRVETNLKNGAKENNFMPKWVGELYLEFHRGTYTSMARNKKYNREFELLMRKTEALAVTDMILFGTQYPSEDINDAWRIALLNQFHDIIPGSSIEGVYEDSREQYKKIFTYGRKTERGMLEILAKNINTDGGIMVYNANSFACGGIIEFNGVKCYADNIPPLGYKVISPLKGENDIIVEKGHMENKFFSISLDESGNMTSIYDKTHGREIVKPGEKCNEIQAFEDFPKAYDAWEISEYYKDKMWTIDEVSSIECIHDGVRSGLKITKPFLSSTIVQTIYLYNDIARIDFETYIDWNEEHILLKAAFPLDIHASEAAYDIQFGSVKRPTHKNTSYDRAKFEVCAHKWADISEDNYGVSILNNCKYGYSAEGSTLKLTLLKSATYPNPSADKEEHTFIYSLYPHSGSYKTGGTIKMAYMLNNPLITLELPKQSGNMPESFSLASVDDERIIIETVKKAEDDNGIIVRMYDSFDRRGEVNITFGFDFKEAYICDLMENVIEKSAHDGRNVKLNIGNFEIVTLKLVI